jgi:hypothetical protein
VNENHWHNSFSSPSTSVTPVFSTVLTLATQLAVSRMWSLWNKGWHLFTTLPFPKGCTIKQATVKKYNLLFVKTQ